MKLLLRLYDADPGASPSTATTSRELASPTLRGAIGFVSQDMFLFQGTVRENIAYGDRRRPRTTIERRPGWPRRTSSSPPCPTATTPWSASGAKAVGRAAPAARDRARHPAGPAHPDARRGDLGGRQRDRGRDPAVARARCRGDARRHGRPSPVDRPQGRPNPRARRRAGGRGRHARRAVRPAGCTPPSGGSRPARPPRSRSAPRAVREVAARGRGRMTLQRRCGRHGPRRQSAQGPTWPDGQGAAGARSVTLGYRATTTAASSGRPRRRGDPDDRERHL